MVARLIIAAALVTAAVALSLAAHDMLAWRSAMTDGDRRFRTAPTAARWHARTVLPGDPARSFLGLDDELPIRRGVQAATGPVQCAPEGSAGTTFARRKCPHYRSRFHSRARPIFASATGRGCDGSAGRRA